MQTSVLKQLSLPAVMALLAATALPACVMARAEAPAIPDVEQEDAGSPPADQVLSTRPDGAPDEDLENPDARIARLSFTQGGVSLQGVGETVKAPATLNRPIAPGDDLTTVGDGRAEVELGDVSVRVGANSAFQFIALDERALRMRLSSGIANVRVRDLGENDSIEIDTPQAVMSILRPGSYRLEVNANGSTLVKVASGAIEARGSSGQSFIVRNQQTATITGTNQLAFTTGTLGAPDSFDEWTLERDQRIDRARTAEASKYVPDDVVGYEDLDQYGTWRNDPEYGYVWAPTTVVAGWTPYRYGRYSYVSGWGWTWIDDAPWGFAPFHYGSWVTIGGRWSWVPGPRHGGRYVGRPGYGRGYWNRPGNWDRPGQPRHDWHIPRPPRDSTVRNRAPLGTDSPRNGYRYLRPEQPGTSVTQPQNTYPRNGSTFQRGNGQRNDGQRNEAPRYENRGGRYAVPVAPQPRAEVQRESQRPQMRPAPSPQPQQQSQPSAQPNPGRAQPGGRFDRGTSRGNTPRER